MESRPGITLREKEANRLTYKGGTFAGRLIEVWGLDFARDRLYRGAVFLEKHGEVRAQYQDVKTLLLQKYGRNMSERTTDSGSVISEWKLPRTASNPDEKVLKCAIIAGPPGKRVKLVYINESIRAAVGGEP